MRLGDLEIESASKDGAQRFQDLRRPSDVQKEIYIQMERNENNKMDRMGQAMLSSQQQYAQQNPQPQSQPQSPQPYPQAAPAPAPSISDQIQQLAQLRDAGHLTEAEFQAKKAELLSRM